MCTRIFRFQPFLASFHILTAPIQLMSSSIGTDSYDLNVNLLGKCMHFLSFKQKFLKFPAIKAFSELISWLCSCTAARTHITRDAHRSIAPNHSAPCIISFVFIFIIQYLSFSTIIKLA